MRIHGKRKKNEGSHGERIGVRKREGREKIEKKNKR